MKKLILIILSLALLLPSFVYGEGVANEDWVVDMGYFGVGGLDLDKKINRASLATVTVRLMGLEDDALQYKGKSKFKDVNNFQGGWAIPYVSIANDNGIMSGISKDSFNPGGNLKYIEALTVFMRILGYEDGIDFVTYPDDHYKKALEIGLADMHISQNEEVLRKTVLDTMIKTLNLSMKDQDHTLYDSLMSDKETPLAKTSIGDIKFNTTIAGIFSGVLRGSKDFTGYKVVLLSKNGTIYGNKVLSKDGKFSFEGFDVSVLAKLSGYKYEVYNREGDLVLESQLQ